MPGIFIDDGYVQPVFLVEAEGLHGALRFEFRPVLFEELAAYYRDAKKLKDAEADRFAVTWAAGRLISWDARDARGQPVTIDAAKVARLHPNLFFRVMAVLRGDEAGDLDPLWTKEKAEQHRADCEAAQAAGKQLGQWRLERDAKN